MPSVTLNRRMLWLMLVLLACRDLGRADANLAGLVPACSNVLFAASYVPPAAKGEDGAFKFAILNETDQPIMLAHPVPTSAHWYARDGSRWLWRASNGTGGSLVDAMQPSGRLIAYRATKRSDPSNYVVVAPHGYERWVQRADENPVLEFKPSCAHCNHPGDKEYRVIFGYAYLPAADEAQQGLLSCGVRSNAVTMPRPR